MANAIWQGTIPEYGQLTEAINKWCTCEKTSEEDQLPQEQQCSAHRMLTDQRILDCMLWAKHEKDWYVATEFKQYS